MLCWQAHCSLWGHMGTGGLRPTMDPEGHEGAEVAGVGKAWGRALSGQCGGACLRSAWSTGPWSNAIPTRPGPKAKTTASVSQPRGQVSAGALSSARHPHASRAAPQGQVAESCFLIQLGVGATWRLESCLLSRTQLLLAQWAGGQLVAVGNRGCSHLLHRRPGQSPAPAPIPAQLR